jgi:hypothetical protein
MRYITSLIECRSSGRIFDINEIYSSLSLFDGEKAELNKMCVRCFKNFDEMTVAFGWSTQEEIKNSVKTSGKTLDEESYDIAGDSFNNETVYAEGLMSSCAMSPNATLVTHYTDFDHVPAITVKEFSETIKHAVVLLKNDNDVEAKEKLSSLLCYTVDNLFYSRLKLSISLDTFISKYFD